MVDWRGNAGGCGPVRVLGVPARLHIAILCTSCVFILGTTLVASAWADNALEMVRALVRVARTEQVLGQTVGAAGQGCGARVMQASTHQDTALCIGQLTLESQRG